MANDGLISNNPQLGWPGDLARSPQGVRSVTELLQRLVREDYLRPRDVEKVTSLPGLPRKRLWWTLPREWQPGWSPARRDWQPPLKVYRVTGDDDGTTILLATANFTYGSDLDATKAPGDYFIVLHKAGDATAFGKAQARNLQLLGHLPGRWDRQDRPVETPEDALEPR